MTTKQSLLKFLYPILKKFASWGASGSGVLTNKDYVEPVSSFYKCSATLNSGASFHFDTLQGKKVLIVNVASNCGYTAQYAELEELNQLYPGKLVILAFPGNDFSEQEPGNDKDIETFCKVNYGLTCLLFKKNPVVGPLQNEVFQWLTDRNKNGWNNQSPRWNFCKYLVDDNGVLQYYFAPYISPLGKEISEALCM
ncbi:MAG: glutathione peroxidase [Chitinophagaceae bacterium]